MVPSLVHLAVAEPCLRFSHGDFSAAEALAAIVRITGGTSGWRSGC